MAFLMKMAATGTVSCPADRMAGAAAELLCAHPGYKYEDKNVAITLKEKEFILVFSAGQSLLPASWA